ncbi:MAG: glycosyltransferase [bacterium]|nr:glycosyltransferase [bacterium]
MKTVCLYNIGVGNTELLAKKMAFWQSQGLKIKMACPEYAVPAFKELICDIEYIRIPFCHPVSNKFTLIFELLKRSLIACFFFPEIAKADTLYSISSVLDELLLPFFIKIFDERIAWVALFENEVALKRPGNIFVRILARVFYRISLLLLKKADRIFAVTEDLKSVLIKTGINERKIVVTSNAVDKTEIEKAISKRESQFDGLFAGRLEEAKGVFDLIKICRKVVEKYPNFSLGIAGTGHQKQEKKLRELVKTLGLEKNIRFLGYVSGTQKFRLLANSRIFLFPSLDESFGVALLEAICSGRKAIAYDLPAYKNIYLNNELETVPIGDIKSFSEKVIGILDEKNFENAAGLKLLMSNKYRYDRIAGIESDNF